MSGYGSDDYRGGGGGGYGGRGLRWILGIRLRPFLVVRFSDCFVFAQMAAVAGAEAVEDTVVAAVGVMEVVAVAEGMAAVVGEEVVEEEATAAVVAEAAGEVAGAGEDAKATGSALTRGAYRFISNSLMVISRWIRLIRQ
jgi:predicted small secreted protein